MPETQTPPAPDSRPETPLAIERLAAAVEGLRSDIAAQGAANSRQLISVLDAIARFDQTLKLLANEMQTLKRDHLGLAERVAALESKRFREISTPPKKRRRRAAKKS